LNARAVDVEIILAAWPDTDVEVGGHCQFILVGSCRNAISGQVCFRQSCANSNHDDSITERAVKSIDAPVQKWSAPTMSQPVFCELLDELFELDSGTATGSTVLKEVPGWSSLTFVGLIAMIDEEYGIALSPSVIMSSETAGDLERKLHTMLNSSEAA
jgi:acyl carrier protein